jgi:hypothetical protein
VRTAAQSALGSFRIGFVKSRFERVWGKRQITTTNAGKGMVNIMDVVGGVRAATNLMFTSFHR